MFRWLYSFVAWISCKDSLVLMNLRLFEQICIRSLFFPICFRFSSLFLCWMISEGYSKFASQLLVNLSQDRHF